MTSADELAALVSELFAREHTAHQAASVDVAALAKKLASSYDVGLPAKEVDARRASHGENKVDVKDAPSFLSLVREALQDRTMTLLVVAAVLSGFIYVSGLNTRDKGGVFESMTILASVCLVVLVQSVTNYKKAQTFALQQELLENKLECYVWRDGALQHVHPRTLVVGDVLKLAVGMVVPADCLLLPRSGDVAVDESALTGESRTVDKKAAAGFPLVLSGTSVVTGEARALVVAVGKRSSAGKILAALNDERGDNDGDGDDDQYETGSALLSRLNVLADQIGKVGMSAAACVFLALVLRRVYHWIVFGSEPFWDEVSQVLNAFILATTVLVVAVPEGLPLASTLALAFSLRALSDVGVQVKHLDSCETMGCVTTICSDKTGTLTENKMRVVHCSATSKSKALLRKVAECSALVCAPETSASRVANAWTYTGSPTEAALLRFCEDDCALPVQTLRAEHKVVSSVPFSSARKMMSVTTVSAAGRIMWVKGAPSVVAQLCEHRFADDGVTATPMVDAEFEQELKALEQRGLRVIALACRAVAGEGDADEARLTLIGVVAMQDALRANVPAAVDLFTRAGVVVRMVTGDSMETAMAIARQARILRGGASLATAASVMSGAEFAERCYVVDGSAPHAMRRLFDFSRNREGFGLAPAFKTDAHGQYVVRMKDFDDVWPKLRVLARCLPGDKLALVRGIKASKLHTRDANQFPGPQIVAVTGDGTNDAPALRAADVGISMGMMGTEVARQASDIILLNDDFSNTTHALVWGRNVEAAVAKFIQFQLTVNLVAMVLSVGGSIAMADSPLTAVQMLWVNMIMDTLGGLALASEQPDRDVLCSAMPLPRHASLISARMRLSIVGQAAYQLVACVWLLMHGEGARGFTVVFNGFVLLQLANEVNARSSTGSLRERFRPSPWFLTVWLVCLLVQVAIVQRGGAFFDTVALDPGEWALCFAVALGSWPWQAVLDAVACRWFGAKLGKRQEARWMRQHHSYGAVDEANALAESEVAKRRWRLVRNALRFTNAARTSSRVSSLGGVSPHRQAKLHRVAGKVLGLSAVQHGHGADRDV